MRTSKPSPPNLFEPVSEPMSCSSGPEGAPAAPRPTVAYPKPGQMGGRLIRKLVALLRSEGIFLPIDSHILIAVSGGADSMALAHLLIHFGRRIVPLSSIRLLHINHGWRGIESDQDEEFVQACGKKWKVPVDCFRLSGEQSHGESWEEVARFKRKEIFEREAARWGGWVMTAHQADDLAETLLWRLFTGAWQTHGAGIIFRHGREIRPFLRFRKSDLIDYLREVKQAYREDSTNFSDRFLRARMRSGLMPGIEKLFPKAIDHLVNLAFDVQSKSQNLGSLQKEGFERSIPKSFMSRSLTKEAQEDPELKQDTKSLPFLLQAMGVKLRRPHFEMLETPRKKSLEKKRRKATSQGWGEVHLPGGWRIIRQKAQSWVLERI